MKKPITLFAVLAVTGLSACANMTQDQRTAAGALAGGAAGLALADRADKSDTARGVATLAGAAAGATLAANSGGAQSTTTTRSCVYPDGRPAPCPVGY
ncbi:MULTISPECIES: glucose-6-phosphate isomerase [unclassified Roseivivax]|uniref:glucose-6-phosphate isomerase n=1 Tax=Roseivivax sp. GX 12232 TaxID=2900547 RepID=UPI001E362F5D|nr:glucose-6-phosphate isomerase [Roseivivax sp. GX 12232]MCE0504213.1 glucose-6-phosphate isomerase [Roseivivax sp. GX 12232]